MSGIIEIEKFETKWFFKKSGNASPLKHAINSANNNKFIYAYEENSNNYSFGSYKSQTDFLKALVSADINNRRFHEVIIGGCKTFADIEYTDMTLDNRIIKKEIEKILLFLFEELFQITDLHFWWSDSSNEVKGSLHLVVDTDGRIWRDTKEQKILWDCVKSLIYTDDKYDSLFYINDNNGDLNRCCVIDFGVYTKNRYFRTILSHKASNVSRVLIPDFDGFNDKYLVSVSINEDSEFYEIPDIVKDKFRITEYNTNIENAELEQIILTNVPDVSIGEHEGCLIKLKNIGNRTCIIGGEINTSDNSYCVIKNNGVYFGCFDDNCRGTLKKIHTFEVKNILPEFIKDFNDYDKLAEISNLSYQHIIEFVARNLVFIKNNMNGFYMMRNVKYGEEIYENMKTITDNVFSVKIDDDYYKLKTLIERERYNYSKSSIDFMPYNETIISEKQLCDDENIFNLFRGFKATYNYDHNYEVEYDLINPITNHIMEAWAKNNKEYFDYVINWMAHIVQKPRKKTGVVIFLKSTKQGAGKDVVWEFIERFVLGRALVGHLNDVEQLTDKFNNSLCFKLLTICDELPTFTRKSNADKLKNLITQSIIKMEQKGIDAISVNDYNNYVMLSNNDYAVHIEPGDRRYFTLELDNKYVGNTGYFDNIVDTCFNDNAGDAMYNYLMRRDISGWQPGNMPLTDFKRELKTYSIPKSLLFIEHLFNDKNILTIRQRVHLSELFDKFKNWLSVEGYNIPYNSKRFTTELRLIDIEFKRMRINGVLKNGTTLIRDNAENSFKSYLKDDNYKFTDNDEIEEAEDSDFDDFDDLLVV